jgi:uncharacterized protein YciI
MATRNLLLVVLAIISCPVNAQTPLTENTLRLDDGGTRQSASIVDVAWYAGRWLGKGFDATVEESFVPPMGGTMIGTFRMIKDEKPAFYEMLLLEPDGDSLVYRVKHFHPNFTGWEEKDGFVSFPLIKIEGNRFYFSGLTWVRDGNKCIHYLAMKQPDGSYKEAVLTYERVPVEAPTQPTSEVPYDDTLARQCGADDYGMKKFILAFLKRGPHREADAAKAAELQRAHLKNIERMAEMGKLVLAGPFLGSGDIRGIYVFDVASIEEAEALTKSDPAIEAGSLEMELHEWYGTAALAAINNLAKRITKNKITGSDDE